MWELDCNWKIVMEVNIEVYYVKSIYLNIVFFIFDDCCNVNMLYLNGYGCMIVFVFGGEKLFGGMLLVFNVKEIEIVGEIGWMCM